MLGIKERKWLKRLLSGYKKEHSIIENVWVNEGREKEG